MNARARAIDLDGVAGLFVYEDGGRFVIGDDGWGLHVLPSAWHKGDRAVAALDDAVPAHKHLPQPARDNAVHRRARWHTRVLAALTMLVTSPTTWWLLVCVALAGLVASAATRRLEWFAPAAALGILSTQMTLYRRKKRRDAATRS
ncbi:MAG: hypothetical protein R2731_18500 [Nocardioides sp.]